MIPLDFLKYMNSNLSEKLRGLLQKDSRLWDEEKKELNEILLKDLVDKMDEKIIELLLSDKEITETFFIKIKEAFVFKVSDFKFFLDENKLDNSYTQYANRIGLSLNNGDADNKVILNWPFKDCVLEGGMIKEDSLDTYFKYNKDSDEWKEEKTKRKEIFFNEVLARDEIDRLEEPKAFYGWKRYTSKGEEKVGTIRRNTDGTISENFVIKGNNLLVLHSLKQQFTGKIKLIYIDPPYNTGSDSFGYNDNFNHSSWLTFMKNRLEIAKELLSDNGVILVSCDDNEQAYLKILMDEIFKRDNFINSISVQSKVSSGASGGGEDKKMKKNTEFILFYCKNKDTFEYNPIYNLVPIDQYIDEHKKEGVGFYYTRVLTDEGEKVLVHEVDGIKIFKHKNYKFDTISSKIKEEKLTVNEAYHKYFKKIFMVTNAQTSILGKVNNLVNTKDELVSYEYIPKTGKSKNKVTTKFIWNQTLVVWFADSAKIDDKIVYKQEEIGSSWTDISWGRLDLEGGTQLKNGKKPEKLLKRIIDLSTKEGDIVLDYHAGSGTTCAVAHKMRRQWIGVEQLDYSENNPEERMKGVILGDKTGISKDVNWQGGGDFIYIQLAKWNEEAKEKILNTKTTKELIEIFDELYEQYFLNYNFRVKEFKEEVIKEEGFKKLPLIKQKEMFVKMLDLNQMYINYSERKDKKYKLSNDDIFLSEEFYNQQ